MTGDVNLTHIRDALNNVHQTDDYGYVFGGSAPSEAWAQLAHVEAVIRAARAFVSGDESVPYADLADALADLEDGQ